MKLAVAVPLLFMVAAQTVSSDSIPTPKPALVRKCRRSSQLEGPECGFQFHKKWRWDDGLRTCEEFTYGGCRGTDNLFDAKEKCEEECQVMTHVPPCPPPLVGSASIEAGCELKRRMKLANGCFEKVVHCPDKQLTGPCQPPLYAQRLPPDCQYVRITGADGCSRSVIDCSAGPTANQSAVVVRSA